MVSWRVAAAAPLTGLALLVSSAPAGAEDVAASTLTNVKTFSSLVEVTVDRSADYSNEDAPVYEYIADVSGLSALDDQQCVFSRDGQVLSERSCDFLIGWFDEMAMTASGNYDLSSEGVSYASWTFTMPADTPPVKAPAQCVIKSAKVVKKTAEEVTVKLVTNNKCKDGSWAYAYAADEGTVGMGMGGVPTKKGLYTIGLKSEYRPADVTVQFSPNGLLRTSTYELRVK